MTYLMLLSAILGGLEGVYRYLQKSVMLVPLARRIGMKETFIYSEIVATTYIYRISILSPQDFPPRAQYAEFNHFLAAPNVSVALIVVVVWCWRRNFVLQ